VTFFTGCFLLLVLLVFFIFALESESCGLDEIDRCCCSDFVVGYSCL
jgi:hypothetical protein